VEQTRSQLPQDSEIQNLVDEIAALIDSTLFLLRFE
jgi:Tfp pilus assembly protein PilO